MAQISQEIVDEIRQKSDIVEIIKEYLPLTQRGKNYFGVCPFHDDHSPSMSVSKERQMFKCFTCGMAGNVFKFVSEYENINYMDAIRKLGTRLGFQLDNIKREKKEVHQKEFEIMNLARLFYENNLNTSQGETARNYLRQRGISEEIQKEFQIGLSLSESKLYEFLKKKKYSENDLISLGLIHEVNGKINDVFLHRITFPIWDKDGNVVGFTGRIYEQGRTPKYLNSKETTIFKKGNILFGYHIAKEYVRREKRVIVVEGNMDAIRMHTSGFQNTVALMGTSLTKEQILMFQKLHVPVILMLDNDDAGALATKNVGDLLEKAGIEVNVVRLSGEKDPDEYIIAHGIDAMEENLKHPISLLEYKLNFLKQNKNLQDAKDLREYVKEVLNDLKRKDSLTIDITLNKLSKDYNISLEVLKSELDKEEQKEIGPPKEEKAPSKRRKTRYEISAEHILYYMMNEAKYIKMYQNKLGYFKDPLYRGIANEIKDYYERNRQIVFADFLSYVETSPLKEEIYEIVGSIKEENLVETSMEDYMNIIKENTWLDKVKELKQTLRQTIDQHQKECIGMEITEQLKKIQEIRKERSVKNDKI